MFIAKVVGSLVSTQKVDSFVGRKLMIVEPYRIDPEKHDSLVTTQRTFVAVDLIGAGIDDYVLITQGSSARMTPLTKDLPVDTVIIGIVDQVQLDRQNIYSRNNPQA
ncbi:MAG TPA: EutN/CcmL family microcompartment protein [Pirellulaceae bacterium]|nr:EutN/CcmL family microcompartment protein [Pirellulaceae bacterium]HMO91436.1 EutN/CcmL family microcompartment protein [Pirellulaceae bacterium]HMP69487.1 EutN/CcmL family microcompartment protein [Pirellulaceae bacterium]